APARPAEDPGASAHHGGGARRAGTARHHLKTCLRVALAGLGWLSRTASAQQDRAPDSVRKSSSTAIHAVRVGPPSTLAGRLDELDESWNGVWSVAVSRDPTGWTAQFRIPLLALRFHHGTNTEFGFNVRRFIRRKNEEDLWRSSGRAQGFYHLNAEGAITGLGDLRRPHDLEVYPYALGRAVETSHDSVGAETVGGYVGGKAGIDAKLGMT